MYHSASRGTRRRRRRKSIFSAITFSGVNGRGSSPTLLRFCTGFLFLSSVVLCHVTIVRYVDDRLKPEVTDDDASVGGGGLLPAEVVDGRSGDEEAARWSNHAGGRRLMSEREKATPGKEYQRPGKATPGLDDRRPDPHPQNLRSSSRPVQPNCQHRPIQGLSTICDHLPCLRALQGSPRHSHPPLTTSSQIPPDVLRRLNRIPGSLDPVHYTLFPFLADVQRTNGILGSVGQLGGVHLGQFAALLSLTADRKSGERIFFSDSFNSSVANKFPGISQFEIFQSHLHDFNFDADTSTSASSSSSSSSSSSRIYVHLGSLLSPDLPQLLLRWDLPRFRLLSVEASANSLGGLELAACLLRDGGIVVLDHPTSSTEAAMATVDAFHAKHGKSAISPIFVAGNKLFLTTSNWRKVYADHFRRKEADLVHLSVVDDGYRGDGIFVVR